MSTSDSTGPERGPPGPVTPGAPRRIEPVHTEPVHTEEVALPAAQTSVLPHVQGSRTLVLGVIAVATGLLITWVGQATMGQLNHKNPVDPQLAVVLDDAGDRLVMQCTGRPEVSLGRRWDLRPAEGNDMVKLTERRADIGAAVAAIRPHLQDARNLNLATPVSADACRFGVINNQKVVQSVITDAVTTGQSDPEVMRTLEQLSSELQTAARRLP